MSTAVLISGQLRTFAQCWPTQRWHILRHFADPHFFITVQRPEEMSAQGILVPLVEEYGADRVHTDFRDDPDLSDQLTPELTSAYHRAPYTNAAPAHQLLLQHWYQNECWKFFQSQTQTILQKETKETKTPDSSFSSLPSVQKFDTIIRLRADLYFHSFDWPPVKFNEFDYSFGCGMHWRRRGILPRECVSPWWGRFGGINDRFAILGPTAAKAYFTVYDKIPELLSAGCPFHPETLVKAALETAGIAIQETLRTEFSTLRTNGQSRPPEIAPWDLAHAALRAA